MIGRLVWENITHRPLRTMLSVLMIAVPVTLILTLIGLSTGFVEDSRRRQNGVGADILVKPRGASIVGFSNSTMPVSLVAKLATEPHVAQAMGQVIATIGGFDAIMGIDPAAFDRMSGGFVFLSGHPLSGPDDLLIDSWYADQRHVQAGGKLNLLNHQWTVAGIVEPGKLGHIFAQIVPLEEVEGGGSGYVSQIYLKLDDKAHTNEVIGALRKKYDEFPIVSMEELQSLISVDKVPLLSTFLLVVEGIGVVIGFLVVSLSMYMAVLQRTREIGILKSLGATKGFIMGLILAEAFFLGLGGTIFGIIFSYGSAAIIHRAMPASLPVAIVYAWWPIAGAIAMGAALLGALYPGTIAVRMDPIEALAYE
jgi:putative ABC transport system permease protein